MYIYSGQFFLICSRLNITGNNEPAFEIGKYNIDFHAYPDNLQGYGSGNYYARHSIFK